ncbi:saccharopine dehydrogenase [Alcanivorax sp. 521-1]|uniref:Saccharopine dehydrogenase n=1 Tax=Alloalcanivorax profundimaris TaxID=2735259 RepID=A0ABS0ALG3_9GAMM|nr:KR domain-containing protein [Alloalcanivorax profundimaris]MBF5054950.1 saccharopine dehydrogenase [Alloalcanivorax profundimaris]
MTSSPEKRVLILGGYGEAGCRLAGLLGADLNGHITLAGRSPDKARDSAARLRSLPGNQADFHTLAIDLSETESAAECPKGYHLLIVACPLSDRSLNALIEGCIRYGTDFIDLVPMAAKAGVFSQWADAIESGTSRFILDAGANPGLPGWLVRHVASRHPDADTLRLWGRYRSDRIGWDGVGDILGEVGNQGWRYRRGWRKAPWWDVRTRRFPGGLGRGVCVPIYLQELSGLPEQLGLERFSFYHAGLNPATDALMTLERFGLLKMARPVTRQSLFFQAMRRFSHPPFGLALVAELEHDGQVLEVALWHKDLYRATAVPAALMARMLLSAPTLNPNYGHLGFWAMQHPDFSGSLEHYGFHFDERRGT